MRSNRVELLAPAKGYESAVAAIEYGADAIYMGAARFGARAAAGNSIEDIARVAEYAHQFGVGLYVTMNTLLRDDELREAEGFAREIVAAGADALIVQDMAYCRMGLGAELHGSTQICNRDVEGVRFLDECGFERVVLERNLSLAEIEKIGRETNAELEVFVHGAICVGCSGECYLSKAMSVGRSGNRGECSQPCRLSYDLVDDADRVVMRGKHLLSVKDFNLSAHVGRLIDCGARSFKIEGRLKDLSYTKNIVSYYRGVLDCEIAKREGLVRSSVGSSRVDFEANPAKSFSRGETSYMLLRGERGVASFDTPKAKGEFVGRVVSVRGERCKVKMERGVTPLIAGDGVCYIGGGTGELFGTSVNESGSDGVITLNKRVGYESPVVGNEIYRNYDRAFEAQLSGSRTKRVIEVRGAIRSDANSVVVSYIDIEGNRAESRGDGEREMAGNRVKMEEVIVTQLRRLGDTIFECSEVDIDGWGGEFIAAKEIALLRREAAERLRALRIERGAGVERVLFEEKRETKHPWRVVSEMRGVTNRLSREFYKDHGAERIERSLELMDSRALRGHKVMHSSYCLRREIGECLREGSKMKGALYIVRGDNRFRLEFDCERCEMSLICEG